jgi:choice-of-anchor B domain-containing protein
MPREFSARPLSPSFLRAALAGAATSVVALTALADEDWRKLADQQPPREGQIWTAGGSSRSAPPAFLGENVYLQAWFPLSAFPGSQGSGNDCWGYTSPSGRRYAIIGLQKGFGFVEVTDPKNAEYVGYISGATSLWHDVKVIGQYAYGVSEGGLGIQVMNLSNIDNGVVTLTRNQSTMGHSSTHNIVSNPASGYLYLVGANVGNGGLVAVSLSDPARPTIVGAWTTHYVHDAQVVTYTSGPYAGREIAFCLNGGFGLEVVDVTNKGSMTRIATLEYPWLTYCHQGWLSEDRRYLYVDDELDEGAKVWTTTTRIFDVQNPGNPVYLGTFTSGRQAIDHNQYTYNGRIYQANYRSGLQIFEYSNPLAPTVVGYFDTHPEDDRAKFNGAWSTYPYFGEDTILISDMEGGLFVVEYDERRLDFDAVATPANVAPDAPAATTIQITGDGTDVLPGSVTLHASINGGPEILVPAADNGDGTFSASLPAAPCFSDIEYYYSATSQTGRTFTHPKTPHTDTLHAYVAASVDVIYQDTFDVTHFSGWNVGDDSDPDTALFGRWIKMQPLPSVSQPGSGYTGSICWITDGRVGDSPTDYEVTGGKTTLMSPIFDLSGATDPRISYWRWYVNGIGGQAPNEAFAVDISSDGGATWSNLETINNETGQDEGGWHRAIHKLAGRVALTSQMRVRFVASDYPIMSSVIEAAIDDFRVTDASCTFCPADYNSSGSADVSDFLDFFDDFGQCVGQPTPCGASGNPDINGDTVVDVADFLDFLDAFGIGCD